ncbi:MAG: hypothetical protein OEY89_16165, partial [Gammaproteobacteria bacterium]|nr:hypothetical protein [Gammaproteobacteria bacterium]
MATLNNPRLFFSGNCPDCGEREIILPDPLPEIGDDFDWSARDYDSIRRFMMEELAARFPDRQRWTPADIEVVIVEVLSAMLDQLSDMLDRVSHEAYLASARRPESVRRLLKMIGYDVVQRAKANNEINQSLTGLEAEKALEQYWYDNPYAMELARREGPRSIYTQYRMVTVNDYAERIEEHPLIERAHAWSEWTGSWMTVFVAIISWNNLRLDEDKIDTDIPLEIQEQVDSFNIDRGIRAIDWHSEFTLRGLLRPFIDQYRMVGQEVFLQDAILTGISMSFSVLLSPNYYRSEVEREIKEVLGDGPSGFFRPGRLKFGEDLHASDLIQTLMQLPGVQNICLNRFKRVGSAFPDESTTGLIKLDG